MFAGTLESIEYPLELWHHAVLQASVSLMDYDVSLWVWLLSVTKFINFGLWLHSLSYHYLTIKTGTLLYGKHIRKQTEQVSHLFLCSATLFCEIFCVWKYTMDISLWRFSNSIFHSNMALKLVKFLIIYDNLTYTCIFLCQLSIWK